MELTIKDKSYRVGRMDARRQFHVVRRLTPLLSGLTDLAALKSDPLAALGPIAETIAAMKDQDADYIIDACLAVTERQQAAGGWAKVMQHGSLMFEDLDMADMLRLAGACLQENLGGFFDALPQPSPPGRSK
ncbi:MAG: phage tail assembly chaperone [Pseudodesulfovibrio sp.]|uniref:phage tail assembly chaperone n=1 Tax=Pseudodesulfovibrio sp. TaxID=2035812 RepID=UPI003D0E6EF4